MRISVTIDDELLRLTKEQALRSGRTVSQVVPDAYLAALAIEAGCEWVTADRDFARFTGLRWRHPLDG